MQFGVHDGQSLHANNVNTVEPPSKAGTLWDQPGIVSLVGRPCR